MRVPALLAIFTGLLFSQPPATPSGQDKAALADEKPVVTKHQIQAGGKTLSYTATTGMMPIRSAHGEIEANLFYVYYALDGTTDVSKRPLMMAFNGGPGAGRPVWLHMGCIGPKRVKMMDDGALPGAAPINWSITTIPGSTRPTWCLSIQMNWKL